MSSRAAQAEQLTQSSSSNLVWCNTASLTRLGELLQNRTCDRNEIQSCRSEMNSSSHRVINGLANLLKASVRSRLKGKAVLVKAGASVAHLVVGRAFYLVYSEVIMTPPMTRLL